MVRDSRTYLRILYLFLAFPLGILYFTVIITGFSVGVGLALLLFKAKACVLLVLKDVPE